MICNLSVHSCQISHLVKFWHEKFQLLDVFENLFLLIIPLSSKFWHFHSIFTIEISQCTLKFHQWTFMYVQERSWKFQFRAAKCTMIFSIKKDRNWTFSFKIGRSVSCFNFEFLTSNENIVIFGGYFSSIWN